MKRLFLYVYGFWVLLPLCWLNIYKRSRGKAPDEWYWADVQLSQIGIKTRWPWRRIADMPKRWRP